MTDTQKHLAGVTVSAERDMDAHDVVLPRPGPRPYSTDEGEIFFGRTDDIATVVRAILNQRLTVITAGSGVGKSSLIQAGVLPTLALLRAHRPGLVGPALLLRGWASSWKLGRGVSGVVAEVLRGGLEKEHTRVQKANLPGDETYLADLARLMAVEVPAESRHVGEDGGEGRRPRSTPYTRVSALTRYVSALRAASQSGDLVLIFDQAEELLGSARAHPDSGMEQEFQSVITRLFQDVPGVSLVLSLRSEFSGRLRPLVRTIEALGKRFGKGDAT